MLLVLAGLDLPIRGMRDSDHGVGHFSSAVDVCIEKVPLMIGRHPFHAGGTICVLGFDSLLAGEPLSGRAGGVLCGACGVFRGVDWFPPPGLDSGRWLGFASAES